MFSTCRFHVALPSHSIPFLINYGNTSSTQEILSLITCTRSAYHGTGTIHGIQTRAIEIQYQSDQCPQGNGPAYPSLDDGLRAFLARATVVDRDRRPALMRMFAGAQAGANKPANAYGQYANPETDTAVNTVLARLYTLPIVCYRKRIASGQFSIHFNWGGGLSSLSMPSGPRLRAELRGLTGEDGLFVSRRWAG
ncbi:hypothetical protein F4777DRAFT_59337 [Nemania sp. FL0916]|nr:hypothetical protein F4777DRAFT_59337 [Nemania sp. FL0916]